MILQKEQKHLIMSVNCNHWHAASIGSQHSELFFENYKSTQNLRARTRRNRIKAMALVKYAKQKTWSI